MCFWECLDTSFKLAPERRRKSLQLLWFFLRRNRYRDLLRLLDDALRPGGALAGGLREDWAPFLADWSTEIDQYLTVLAYNKGTLMTSAIEDDVSMPKATKHSSRRRRESLEKEAAAVREAQYRKEQLHSKVKMTR